MKKEDVITYVILWSVLIGICLYLIYTGFPFSIYAKNDKEIQIETEDPYLYEQLVAENEKQVEKKQKEEEEKMAALLLEEQEKQKQREAQAEEEEQALIGRQETAAVLSSAASQVMADGNYLSSCFIVDPNTTLTESDVPLNTLMTKDMSLDKDSSSPQILIYHTHATEGFIDSVDGDASTTVVGIGDYLEELLTVRYGYHVLHDTEAYDLAEGELNRSRAYNYARDGLEKILEENPSIEIIIDLHRDGVSDEKHLVTDIEGKPTAQIMFFNGLSKTNESGELNSLPNPYIQDNLAFSLQLEMLCDHYYPDFIRSIYVKGYRYNLHLRPRSLLLEVGAQTNTVEEARNAMEPFAEILDKLLKGT